jgi:hypothetical protein
MWIKTVVQFKLNIVTMVFKLMLFPDRISYEDLYELLCIRHRAYVSLEQRERMNNGWASKIQKKYFKDS